VSFALGGLAYYVKSYFAGDQSFAEAQNANLGVWTWEAVDNSGVLGIISDANNISEKWTRGRGGVSWFTGSTARRYQSRTDLGALLGPTYDLVADAMNVTGSGFAAALPKEGQAGWTEASTHSVGRLMSFQNLFFLRRTFDEIEKQVNATMGVTQRREAAGR
jgi:hypothetical protein